MRFHRPAELKLERWQVNSRIRHASTIRGRVFFAADYLEKVRRARWTPAVEGQTDQKALTGAAVRTGDAASVPVRRALSGLPVYLENPKKQGGKNYEKDF